MRRSIAVLFALTGVIGVVGSAASAGSPDDATSAPDKTAGPSTPAPAPPGAPPSSVPPLGTPPVQPTAVAPSTSAWIPTTTMLAPPTVPMVTQTTGVPATVGPPTAAPTPGFDGLGFLTEVYAAVNGDPLTLIDIAERRTIINSAADLFMAHLLGVTMTNRLHGGPPTPIYTVAADGKGVTVCADTGTCDTFGDFVAPTGLLESFSVNGIVIDDTIGVSRREVVVESLNVDSALCFLASDGTLSCIVLLSSEGAATALSWDQAMFTGFDGGQFLPDLMVSAFAPSIADGGVGSAHLVFPGAPLDGDLTVPVVSGISGTPSVASIPIRAL